MKRREREGHKATGNMRDCVCSCLGLRSGACFSPGCPWHLARSVGEGFPSVQPLPGARGARDIHLPPSPPLLVVGTPQISFPGLLTAALNQQFWVTTKGQIGKPQDLPLGSTGPEKEKECGPGHRQPVSG